MEQADMKEGEGYAMYSMAGAAETTTQLVMPVEGGEEEYAAEVSGVN